MGSKRELGTARKQAITWMEATIRTAVAEIDDLYSKYRLNEALMAMFKLFTDEFSGWYLEMIKPAYQAPIDAATLTATLGIFEQLMKIVHPFMPFITEELYQNIKERNEGESISQANHFWSTSCSSEQEHIATRTTDTRSCSWFCGRQ